MSKIEDIAKQLAAGGQVSFDDALSQLQEMEERYDLPYDEIAKLSPEEMIERSLRIGYTVKTKPH